MKQVKEQLEEMTRLGVIESVEEPTEWCAGMVAVSKPGGKIRICVDLTKLNQYIRRENYPLPATEHILGQLGNACYFSKLDANSGFRQFGLAKESQKLTTFITPFGRFFFKRIPFGITSAPEIFQRKMTQLLGKIEGVVCFMDDIVVYGSSLEEHNERVRQVLKKIQEEGMTLNPEKCQFGVKTVKFLGHTLSSEGLFIDEEKLDAITKMEAPRSTKELKSFLGMVNYLGKFIPNLADKLQPLNSLLSTKNEWVWDEPQKKSFNLLKQELVSRPNLALFDPSRTTIVSADASSFGLGGVLRQEQPDGSLKPIAYVSRTLSETEKRYSQIEKEGLAIVWTCDRLKDYVTGIKIHIETDHKPLIAIFTSKSLEDMTPRLQRLKMRMMRYSYQISHIAGKKQIVADMLSRKPMSKPHKDELEEELSAYIQSIEFPATEERLLEISRKQKEDSLCSQLAKYCMSGWPKNKREVDPALRGYWQFQEDLTYQNGLLLRGQRILIPKSLRKDILEKLHQGHFGINKCRSRAKESVWWLGISQEIERMVSSCTKCLKERKPKHEPLMPSEFPIRPWQKVGMDLFYLNGRWYLIVCDYYSRYPEISLLQNLTAQEVISRLKSIFARHGTPETVRSDNGPQFQKVLGSEFSKFSKEWSFKHITSSPKFPQSNGFIEAIIKNIKQSFKKEEDCYLTLQAYRTMPLESGYSPAELLMGRRLRTSVPAIESSLMPRYLDSEALQEREKRRVINQKRLYDKRHDVHSLPPLQQGDSVWIRDQRVEGTVLHKSEEPRSYWVQTPQGKVRRNRLHLTPLPKMGGTMDASEEGQRQEQRNEETPTSTSTRLSRRCKDDQEQETEEDCPTPTASSTRDGRMQRDNQDQDPEKSLPSMPAMHTRYGRAVKIPRSTQSGNCLFGASPNIGAPAKMMRCPDTPFWSTLSEAQLASEKAIKGLPVDLQTPLPSALYHLEKFEGNGLMPFDKFIRDFELVYDVKALDDSRRRILLDNHLRGAARELALQASQIKLGYNELKENLEQRFSRRAPKREARKKFFSCRQRPGEKVKEYANRVRNFASEAESDGLRINITEVADIFLTGLCPNLWQRAHQLQNESWEVIVSSLHQIEERDDEYSRCQLEDEEGSARKLRELTSQMARLESKLKNLETENQDLRRTHREQPRVNIGNRWNNNQTRGFQRRRGSAQNNQPIIQGARQEGPQQNPIGRAPQEQRKEDPPAATKGGTLKGKALVDELEEAGIIEGSTSLWNSHLFPVAKTDGSVRITMDLRLINEATEFFPFPIPRVEDNLRAFAGAKVFSTLDLTSGFFQIRIPESDRDYFTFSLPWGRYRFTRLPQGVKNSAQIFQWAMNLVLGDLLYKCVRLYIDDVIVYSDSHEQHVADLAAVLERSKALHTQRRPGKPFEHLALDFTGPLEKTSRGHSSILTIVDLFTKFPILIPTRDQCASTVVKALLESVITIFGIPKTILSDRGSAFISCVFKMICNAMGVSAVNTTAWRPQSDGAVERLNRTVIESLRRCEAGSNWDDILPMVALAIRTTEHSSTGFTPVKLVFGHELRLPQPFQEAGQSPVSKDLIAQTAAFYERELTEEVEKIREVVRQTYLSEQEEARIKFENKRLRNFNNGDLVLVERMHETKGRHKFEPRYGGPYEVLKRAGDTVYLLKNLETGNLDKYHIIRLKQYHVPIRIFPTEEEETSDDNLSQSSSDEDHWIHLTGPAYLPNRSVNVVVPQRVTTRANSEVMRRGEIDR
ncbi:K02A2.6-like, partial [Cordylochernes scorpioides]